MQKRRIRAAVLCAVLAWTGTACSAADKDDGPPGLGPVPVVADPSGITRPMDAYLVGPEVVRLASRVAAEAEADCLRGFGFGRDAAAGAELFARTSPPPSGVFDPLWGAFDPGQVILDGYRPRRTDADRTYARYLQALPQASPAENAVMFGRDAVPGAPTADPAGRPLPTGGCHQVGQDAVGVRLAVGVAGLGDLAPPPPLDDPRFVAVVAAWRTCMEGKGLRGYADPVAAWQDPRWTDDGATEEQRGTAAADFACKVSTNLVGVAVAVETAYDKRWIDGHAEQLADYRGRVEDFLRRYAGGAG